MKKISFSLSGFLDVLTRPQRRHFLVYIVGLIWLLKFRSIREIAMRFGNGKVDGLHHFFTGSPGKTRILQEETARQAVEFLKGKPVRLLLDDTPCERAGNAIEGIGIHHSAKGLVKGLCAVTAVLKSGCERFTFAIRGYRTKKSSPPKEFKSKIQIALEILQEARRRFPGVLTVLFDSWYTCEPILKGVEAAGWIYLGAIKRNRILKVDGRKTRVEHLAKGSRSYKTVRAGKKRFRVAKKRVHLPDRGAVLLFISKGKDGTRFFVTNDLSLSEKAMVALYGERFWIETYHREIKQYLGFGELFMRSWSGVEKHWTLVGLAYNLVARTGPRAGKSFRQKIRHFQETVSSDLILHAHRNIRFIQKPLKRAA